jgi:hypothetical protein
MRTKNTSNFKRRLEALESARAVVLSVMQQIGVKIYREKDLQPLVRQAADDLMDPSFRARARSSPLFFLNL